MSSEQGQSSTLSQKELESPVKGYQLQSVKDEIVGIKAILERIEIQTKGVVSFEIMEKYVDKRIDEKTAHLVQHKANTTKLGWALLLLVIGDIVTRVFGVIK
jgi:calcineurin-like phosphoesterase